MAGLIPTPVTSVQIAFGNNPFGPLANIASVAFTAANNVWTDVTHFVVGPVPHRAGPSA